MATKQQQQSTRQVRILIIDDHPMMRAGLAAQLEGAPDLAVCGEAEGINDALAALESTHPHLAIIDVALKDGHGIDLVKDIKHRFPNVKMLVLSTYKESLYAERALRAGAMGYLNKQETGQRMLEAIRTVLAGDLYISRELTQRLIGQAIGARSTAESSPVETLSDREMEVFKLIGEGLTTNKIAGRLYLSPHTIETYREKIKYKLNLRNANELQREATQWLLENC